MEFTFLFSYLVSFLLVVSSQPCSKCGDCCPATGSYSPGCQCDDYCQFFMDCCGECSSNSIAAKHTSLPTDVSLGCISVLVNSSSPVIRQNQAFYMISSCPGSWTDPINLTISGNCITGNPADPPVSDTRIGLVYRNEYCALCNGATELAAWPHQLACSKDMAVLNSSVIKEECYSVSFHPPDHMQAILPPRSCIPHVASCLPYLELASRGLSEEEYSALQDGCKSSRIELVRGIKSGTVYRNRDCASCRAESSTECFELRGTKCKKQRWSRPRPFQEAVLEYDKPSCSLSFVLTLKCLAHSSKRVKFTMTCPKGEIPVGLVCKPMLCPESYSKTGGKCAYAELLATMLNSTSKTCFSLIILVSNDSFSVPGGNNSLEQSNYLLEVIDYDEYGRPIICQDNSKIKQTVNCSSDLVAIDSSEYVDLMNNSIVFESKIIEVQFYDIQGRPLLCPDLLKMLPSPLLGILEVTYTGCSVSVLGISAVILTYCIFRELQTFPGMVLLNVCFTILATSVIGLVRGVIIQNYPYRKVCSTLAVILHYFYLAQFAWMSIFAFEILKTIYQARTPEKYSKQKWPKVLCVYGAIGWFLPLLINTATLVLYFTTSPLMYGVKGQKEIAECWINHYESFIAAFLLPLAFSLVCDLVFLTLTTAILCCSEKYQSKLGKSNVTATVRVWLAIFAITGATWIFGFLAILCKVEWMWYIFVILNSTQGFRISFAFIFTKKIYSLYVDLIRRKVPMALFQSSKIKFLNKSLTSGEEEMKLQMVLVPLVTDTDEEGVSI